jgi:cyanophycinase-like exopeptidase
VSVALPVLVDQHFQIRQQFGHVLDFIEDDGFFAVGVQKPSGIAAGEGAV